MELFFNDYDRVFIADTFKGTFIDAEGNKITDDISGASVSIAEIEVNIITGQPRYCVNEGSETIEGFGASVSYFGATIDAELGVLVIPNAERIKTYQNTHPGFTLAAKITGYTIDVGQGFVEACCVNEAEFVRIVKENFDKFNSATNYYGQSTAYGYHKVDTEYPRISYAVGYSYDGVPICVDYSKKSLIRTWYSSYKTEEKAKEGLKLLSKITEGEWKDILWSSNSKTALELLKEKGLIDDE